MMKLNRPFLRGIPVIQFALVLLLVACMGLDQGCIITISFGNNNGTTGTTGTGTPGEATNTNTTNANATNANTTTNTTTTNTNNPGEATNTNATNTNATTVSTNTNSTSTDKPLEITFIKASTKQVIGEAVDPANPNDVLTVEAYKGYARNLFDANGNCLNTSAKVGECVANQTVTGGTRSGHGYTIDLTGKGITTADLITIKTVAKADNRFRATTSDTLTQE